MRNETNAYEVVKEAIEAGEKVEPPKMVVLKSHDDEEFEVDLDIANQSKMIKNMIDDGCVKSIVPLPNVAGRVLAKVVEYWKQHTEGNKEELQEWDKEFIRVDKDELLEMIMAADYLNAKPLLDLCCQAMADTIKNMSVENVREYFEIENDFTPEEERKVRNLNRWAFE